MNKGRNFKLSNKHYWMLFLKTGKSMQMQVLHFGGRVSSKGLPLFFVSNFLYVNLLLILNYGDANHTNIQH
jgi:hypothetical protein